MGRRSVDMNCDALSSRNLLNVNPLPKERSFWKEKAISWIPTALGAIAYVAASYVAPRICLGIGFSLSILSFGAITLGIRYSQANTLAKIGCVSLCLLGAIGLGNAFLLTAYAAKSLAISLTAFKVIKIIRSLTILTVGIGYLFPLSLSVIKNGYQQLKEIGTKNLQDRTSILKETQSMPEVTKIGHVASWVFEKIIGSLLYIFPHLAYWFRPSNDSFFHSIQRRIPLGNHLMALKLRVQQNPRDAIQEDILKHLDYFLVSNSESVTLDEVENFIETIKIVAEKLQTEHQEELADRILENIPTLCESEILDQNLLTQLIRIQCIQTRLIKEIVLFFLCLEEVEKCKTILEGILKDIKTLSQNIQNAKHNDTNKERFLEFQNQILDIEAKYLRIKNHTMTSINKCLIFQKLQSVLVCINQPESQIAAQINKLGELLEFLNNKKHKDYLQKCLSFFLKNGKMAQDENLRNKFLEIPTLIKILKSKIFSSLEDTLDHEKYDDDDIDIIASFSYYVLKENSSSFWIEVQQLLGLSDQSKLIAKLSEMGLTTQTDLKLRGIYPMTTDEIDPKKAKEKFFEFLNPSIFKRFFDWLVKNLKSLFSLEDLQASWHSLSQTLAKILYRSFVTCMIVASYLIRFRHSISNLPYFLIFGIVYGIAKFFPVVRNGINKVKEFIYDIFSPFMWLISQIAKRRLLSSTQDLEEAKEQFVQGNWQRKVRILNTELFVTLLSRPLIYFGALDFFIGIEIVELVHLIFLKFKEWIQDCYRAYQNYMKRRIRQIRTLDLPVNG